jgi:hypothetical protein
MAERQPNIILRGGCARHLTEDEKARYLEDTSSVLKVHLGNRHEHFAPSSETMAVYGRVLRVFDWVDTTYVAE